MVLHVFKSAINLKQSILDIVWIETVASFKG
jgi:hypothetical protein